MNPKYTHKMIALKPLKYAGVRYGAEAIFYAKKKDARILTVARSAKEAPRDPVTIAPIPATVARAAQTYRTRDMRPGTVPEDMAALREAYFIKLGRRAYNGWDAATLRAKMAEHDAAQG